MQIAQSYRLHFFFNKHDQYYIICSRNFFFFFNSIGSLSIKEKEKKIILHCRLWQYVVLSEYL